MIQRVRIRNFRSIEETELSFAPITILFGPTSSGKSSVFYSLLVLRNFLINPNQATDGFFGLGFQNLGGFEACVYNHEGDRDIEISVTAQSHKAVGAYGITLGKNTANLSLKTIEATLEATVAIPYGLNQSFATTVDLDGQAFNVNWNGISCSATPAEPTAELQSRAVALATRLNMPAEEIRKIDLAPPTRGFFRFTYSPVPVTPSLSTDEEVATLIMNDQYLSPRISGYLEDIVGRTFSTYTPAGSSIVYFQTMEKKSKTPINLVNEGYGINQLVYILTKMLRLDARTILVEEPEVHLHPEVIRRFTQVCCQIAKREKKQLIFTTHSSQLLTSLAASVAAGTIPADDVGLIEAGREYRSTHFKQKAISKSGQIEGGLSVFDEPALEDVKTLLNAHDS